MSYIAVYEGEDGNSGVYLTKDSQMDEHLERGAKIMFENGDNSMELIATPEDGFLTERPVFPESKRSTVGRSDLEKAAIILLGMEE